MSIVSEIIFGNNKLKIDKEGSISTTTHTHPPLEDEITLLPFRKFFTDENNSNDMTVNGSVTPVEFTIEALQEETLSVKSIQLTIVDAGASLSEFGNLPALTNGCDFIWSSQQFGEIVIANELQTNFDFVELSGGSISFGGTTPFITSNVVGNEEGVPVFIDFQRLFGFQYGIPLRKGSKDKLFFRINDNISAVTQFRAIAYGNKF